MVYKALHDMVPSYIKDLCVLVATDGQLDGQLDGERVASKTSTKAGDQAYAVIGPQA